jgi:hypothetical protein
LGALQKVPWDFKRPRNLNNYFSQFTQLTVDFMDTVVSRARTLREDLSAI